MKHAVFASLALNLTAAAVTLLIGGVSYELNDDAAISRMICAFGEYKIGFVNYFLCYLLGRLYELFPVANVYTIFLLLAACAGMAGASYVLLRQLGMELGLLLVSAIVLLTAVDLYTSIQFTKVSAVLMLAGAAFLFSYCFHNATWPYAMVGWGFALVGSLIRFDNLLLFSAFFLAYWLACSGTFWARRGEPEIRRKILAAPARSLLLVALPACGLQFWSTSTNTSSAEMAYYYSLRPAKSELMDYGLPSYQAHQAEYQQLGFSENDYQMLRSWYFDNTGFLDKDRLESVVRIKDTASAQSWVRRWQKGITQLDRWVYLRGAGVYVLALLAVTVAGIGARSRAKLLSGSLGLTAVALFLYLAASGRCNYRAQFGIWIFAAVLPYLSLDAGSLAALVARMNGRGQLAPSVLGIVLAGGTLLACAAGAFLQGAYVRGSRNSAVNEGLQRHVRQHADKLFFNYDYALYDGQSAIVHPLRGDKWLKNFFRLGGWTDGLEAPAQFLRRYNVENPYRDMIDNPRVSVVFGSPDAASSGLALYLNEHYSAPDYTVTFIREHVFGDAYVFRAVSQKRVAWKDR